MRDLLRKRCQLVRQRTTQILSMQNLLARNLNFAASGDLIKTWQASDIDALALLPEHALAAHANLAVMHCLDAQMSTLEKAIVQRAVLREHYRALQAVSGIGTVLALAIALETGDIGRFASPGNIASCARTVSSRRESNGKKKGEGNTKCGNRHLAGAFVEAARFAVRYDERIRHFSRRGCRARRWQLLRRGARCAPRTPSGLWSAARRCGPRA